MHGMFILGGHASAEHVNSSFRGNPYLITWLYNLKYKVTCVVHVSGAWISHYFLLMLVKFDCFIWGSTKSASPPQPPPPPPPHNELTKSAQNMFVPLVFNHVVDICLCICIHTFFNSVKTFCCDFTEQQPFII